MQQCRRSPFGATCGSIHNMLAGIIFSMVLVPGLAASKLRARQPLPPPMIMPQPMAPAPAVPVAPAPAVPMAMAPAVPMAMAPVIMIPPADVPVAAPPQAGDLIHAVKDQLAGGHQKLGRVAASLMSVQNEVDKTEQSMLGKVLDLQTARTFFTRHEEIDTANDKLTEEIRTLNTQVDGLSSTLSKTQRAYLRNGQLYRDAQGKLHNQIVEDGALVGSMNAELAKEDEVQKQLQRLTKIHKELMAEAENATETGMRANAMLKQARSRSSGEVGKHKSLREQLVRMNNYSMGCHTNVVKASKKLGMALVTESKDSQAVVLTMRQKKKANEATEQRLLAEHALIVSEVKRIEKESLQELNKVRDMRNDFRTLEHNIVGDVRELETKILAQKERVKSLTVDLMENQQAEMEHNEKKIAMEEHLDALVKEVRENENPILVATTEAQNTALQSELEEAYVLWRAAKTSETAALLNIDQANATMAAVAESWKWADEAIWTARDEGGKKVAEAVKAAALSKAKSQLIVEKAEAALAEKCNTDWGEIWKKKRVKLSKCKQWEEDMSTEKAKMETMKQTLNAQVESQ